MPWKRTLPKLAGLCVVGAASGLWLGGAAVGEIDPFFYSAPEPTFVSDRMAYRSPDWAEVQIGEYRQDGLLEGIGAGPMPGAVYASPAVASYGESWSAASAEQAEPVRVWSGREQWAEPAQPVRVWSSGEMVAERAEPDPERQRVERYASYRITEEEPDREPVEDEPELYAAAQEFEGE